MELVRKIEVYMTIEGEKPYSQWLNQLKDKVTKASIVNSVTKMENGNFGVSASVGNGVIELKIDFGPGYRLYYALENHEIILLLLGGSKKGQQNDIDKAKEYLTDYRSRDDDDKEKK